MSAKQGYSPILACFKYAGNSVLLNARRINSLVRRPRDNAVLSTAIYQQRLAFLRDLISQKAVAAPGENRFPQNNFGIKLLETSVPAGATARDILALHHGNYYLAGFSPQQRALVEQRVEKLISDGFPEKVAGFLKDYISAKYHVVRDQVNIESLSVNGSSLYSLCETDRPRDVDMLAVVKVDGLIVREIVFDFPGLPATMPEKIGGMIIESAGSLEQQSQHTHTVVGLMSHLGGGITIYGKRLNRENFPPAEKLIHALTLIENMRGKDLRKTIIRLGEALYILHSEKLFEEFTALLPPELKLSGPDLVWGKIDSLYSFKIDRQSLGADIGKIVDCLEAFLIGKISRLERRFPPKEVPANTVTSRRAWKKGFVDVETKSASEQLEALDRNHDFNVWLNVAWQSREENVLGYLAREGYWSSRERQVIDWALASNIFLPENIREEIFEGRKTEAEFLRLRDRFKKINRRLSYLSRALNREIHGVKKTLSCILRPVADLDAAYGKSDLHVHSQVSDGKHTAEEILIAAVYLGLKEVSITDHNEYQAIPKELRQALKSLIVIRPGLEADSYVMIEGKKINIHLLAYDFNPEVEWPLKTIDFNLSSIEYQGKIWQSACRECFGDENYLPFPETKKALNYEDIRGYLLGKGMDKEPAEAFIRTYKKYFQAGEKPYFGSLEEMAALAERTGGKLVFAHPVAVVKEVRRVFNCDLREALGKFELFLSRIKDRPLFGLEVDTYEQTPELARVFRKIADNCGLACSAGSDFHGLPIKSNRLGLAGETLAAEKRERLDDHYRDFGERLRGLANPAPEVLSLLASGIQYDQYLAAAWVIRGAELGLIDAEQAAVFRASLIKHLNDPACHPVIHDFLFMALGFLGGKESFEQLTDFILNNPGRSEGQDYYLRRALERVMATAGQDLLIACIERSESILASRATPAAVKVKLIKSLGMVYLTCDRFREIPEKLAWLNAFAASELKAKVASGSEEALTYIQFIGDIKSYQSIDYLFALHDTTKDPKIKAACREALLDIYLDFDFPFNEKHLAVLQRLGAERARLALFFRDDKELTEVRRVFSERERASAGRLRVMEACFHGLLDMELNGLGGTDSGGQIVYAVELARSLAATKETNVVVFTRRIQDKKNYQKTEYLVGEDMIIVRIPFGPEAFISRTDMWQQGDSFVRAVKRFFRMTRFKTDVIHVHSVDGASVELMQMARQAGVPLVFTVHACGVDKLGSLSEAGKITNQDAAEKNIKSDLFFRILYEEMALRWADRIVVSTEGEIHSQWGVYWNSGLAREKFSISPPGIDQARFSPSRRETDQALMIQLTRHKVLQMFLASITPENYGKPAILFLSRLTPRKNPRALLELFLESERIRDRYNLLLAGGGMPFYYTQEPNFFRMLREDSLGGEEKEAYLDLCRCIEENGLQGRVAFLGTLDHYQEVPEVYRIVADGLSPFIGPNGIFCNPAFYEPFGLTILESLSSGLITVATANGGPRETIKDRKTGFLVDASSTSDMVKVFESVDSLSARKKARIRNKARREMEDFYSWSKRGQGFLGVYLDLIKKDRG